MSQPDFPKQFLSIFKGKPLINQTIERITGDFKKGERILIIPEELKKITRKFVGGERIIIEPMRRNTTPAICLVAMVLKKEYGDGIMHIMPADHLITRYKDFIEALKFGGDLAEQGFLVTYGIKPTRSETGYGYIKVGKRICAYKNIVAFEGAEFKEKPSLNKAKMYIKTDRYLWNSGIFSLRIEQILKEIEKFTPEVYRGVANYLQTGKKAYFSQISDISIDYGIMEKSDRLCVVKGNFRWDDVGSWLALERYFKKDKSRNILIGNTMGLEIEDSIVYTYGVPVKVYGIKGLIVVVSPRGVLVCKKGRASDLKKLLRERRI